MKNQIYITLFLLLSGIINSYSQCENIKTINRPDNTTMKYFNPKQIMETSDFEVGSSIYYNQTTKEYFISFSVVFKTLSPRDITGNLIIQLEGSNDGILLEIDHSDRVRMNERDLSISLIEVDNHSLKLLKKHPIKSLYFSMDNQFYGSTSLKNKTLYIEQLKCL